MLTFEQIKDLIEMVSRHHLGGLEVERSGFRLKIVGQEERSPALTAGAGGALVSAPPAPTASAPAVSTLSPAAEAAPPREAGPPAGSHVLTSPIVGTFYAATSPDADPYVKAGDRVKKGQVLCIVEAMKLMNEIESDVDGTVLEIYPKNGQPVEFGEPLFAINAG